MSKCLLEYVWLYSTDLLDILWQRTTLGGGIQSPLLEPELDVEPRESRPAELERYGGGLSPSNTVRFGGALIHFW